MDGNDLSPCLIDGVNGLGLTNLSTRVASNGLQGIPILNCKAIAKWVATLSSFGLQGIPLLGCNPFLF